MQYAFKKLASVSDLAGRPVVLRLDLNVPMAGGHPRDSFRIDRAMATLKFLSARGARTLLISHLDPESGRTLAPVAAELGRYFPVEFASTLAEAKEKHAAASAGAFTILENVRTFPGETENSEPFAKELASFGTLFVNDAFSVSHRAHASIVGIPRFLPSVAGPLFASEVAHLRTAFSPVHPFLFILGGAKFETKLPLVEKFLKTADTIAICGALANDFFKLKGFEVGCSKTSAAAPGLERLLGEAKIVLPSDLVVRREGAVIAAAPDAVRKDDAIVDAGRKTSETLQRLVKKSGFVLWNGPLGAYEEGFSKGTERLAVALAESKGTSIVGGGDTIAVVSKLHLLHHFSFVSTGGGAMLDFLANETLPGIRALEENAGRFSF